MKIPEKLKIPQPELPTGLEIARDLAKQLVEEIKDGGKKTPGSTNERPLPAAFEKEILAVVINVWRIKSKMTDALSRETKEELTKEDVKKIARYLESINNSFTHLGIEIIDRAGESFDYGLPEKVVTTKPQEGLKKELVLETLRPTVKWNNQMYPGEVEIATPIANQKKRES